MNITRSPKTWISRILAAGAAVAVSVTLATGTAHAFIPPSPSTYAGTPSAVVPSLYCGGGRINISVLAAVQSGYTGGQWATFRYEAYSGGRLVGRSNWQAAAFLPYSTVSMGATTLYGRSLVGGLNLPATPGYAYEVAVQVAWYTAAGWSYSQWMAPTGFRSGYQGPALAYSGGTRECRP